MYTLNAFAKQAKKNQWNIVKDVIAENDIDDLSWNDLQ